MRGCRECFLGGSAMGGFARGSRSPRGCGGKTRHSFPGLLCLRYLCGFLMRLSLHSGHTCGVEPAVEPSPRVGCFGSTRGEGSVDAGVVQSLSNGDTDAETVSFSGNFTALPPAAARGESASFHTPREHHDAILEVFTRGDSWMGIHYSSPTHPFTFVMLSWLSANIQRNEG